MINKLIYINRSLNKLTLSIKTFDIYFLDTFTKHLNKNRSPIIQYKLLCNYQYIINLYKTYNYLCLDEFQCISLTILKKYCNNSEFNMDSEHQARFQYLYNQYLIHNKYEQDEKKNNLLNIKLAIIYIYILHKTQNSHGFYKLIQYFLII